MQELRTKDAGEKSWLCSPSLAWLPELQQQRLTAMEPILMGK